jgi:hypothetical protein
MHQDRRRTALLLARNHTAFPPVRHSSRDMMQYRAVPCLPLARNGPGARGRSCPLSGVKRTWATVLLHRGWPLTGRSRPAAAAYQIRRLGPMRSEIDRAAYRPAPRALSTAQ